MSDPEAEERGGTRHGCVQWDCFLVGSLPQKDLQVSVFISSIMENKERIDDLVLYHFAKKLDGATKTMINKVIMRIMSNKVYT